MIALRISSYWLDLAPSTAFNLKLSNPVFDRENIERLFSEPFTIQLTDTNTAALRHAHRLDVRIGKKIEGIALYLGGSLFENGVALVTDRSDSSIELAFQNDQMDWIAKFKALHLRDLDMPVVVPDAAYLPDIDLTSVPVFEPPPGEAIVAYIELNGNLYNSGALFNADDLINAINADFPGLAEVYNQGVDTITIRLHTSAKPDLSINLIPGDPDISGEVFTTFFHDPQQHTGEEAVRTAWGDYLTDVLATPDDHVFPVVEAPDFFDTKNPDWGGYLNYTSTSGGYPLNEIGEDLLPGETALERGWAYALVPMPFLYKVLNALFAQAGATSVAGDFYEAEDLQKIIVFNNRTIDKVYHPINFANPTVPFGYIYPPFNGFDNAYNLGNHLPDVTLYEYLIKLGTMFGLLYKIEGGTAFVRTIASKLGQTPENWTDRFEPYYRSVPPQYDSYELDFTDRDDDSAVSGQLEKITTPGEDPLTLESQVFSLYYHAQIEGDRTWQVPFYNDGGTSIPLEITDQCPVMLLLYHGLQPDSADPAHEYPFASHHNTNLLGEEVNAYSLNWDGSAGRYEKFWKQYVTLLTKGEPLTKVARLTIDQLLAWRRNPTKPIWCYQPEGSFTAIVKEISVKISLSDTPSQPLKCTLDMITINV